MKSPLSKFVPELERSYNAALEGIAADRLRSDKVRMQLHNAAKSGRDVLRIALPNGIDVRDTDGAAILMEWAAANALRVDWVSRKATLEDGREVTGYDVEISWRPVEFRP